MSTTRNASSISPSPVATGCAAPASGSDEGGSAAGAVADEPGRESGAPSPDEPPAASLAEPAVIDIDVVAPIDTAVLGRLSAALAAALREMRVRGEVRLRLVGDEEMARAHVERCGAVGTTDVITFDLTAGAAAVGAPLDADLLVCLDEARRQATRRGHDVARECTLYALHGVLHCLGYGDATPEGYAAMHAREDEVLEAIGLGRVFGAAPPPPPEDGR